jgi:hypothetical protein
MLTCFQTRKPIPTHYRATLALSVAVGKTGPKPQLD